MKLNMFERARERERESKPGRVNENAFRCHSSYPLSGVSTTRNRLGTIYNVAQRSNGVGIRIWRSAGLWW